MSKRLRGDGSNTRWTPGGPPGDYLARVDPAKGPVRIVPFTPKGVLSLPLVEGETRSEYRDAEWPELLLRVTATARVYFTRYRTGGRGSTRRRVKLGTVGVRTLQQARRMARAIRGQRDAGADPQGQRREAERAAQARREAGTVAGMVDRFITARETDKRKPLRRKTADSWRSLLKVHVRGSALGGALASELHRRTVRSVLEAVGRKHPTTANRLLELLRVAYAWAVDREELPASPCAGLKKGPSRKRERVLSHAELRRVLLALDVEQTGEPSEALAKLLAEERGEDAKKPEPAAAEGDGEKEDDGPSLPKHPLQAAAWRLLLLTGLRLREVLDAEWPEVDFKAKRWTIPAARMKAGRAHTVPLSADAVKVLEGLRLLAGGSPYVVPSPVDPSKPLASLQASLRRLHALSGTAGWSAHDFRHTLRSELSAMRYGFEVKELILAHALPGLAGTYDHHAYLSERADALAAWAKALARIKAGEGPAAAGGNVVAFPAR